MGEKPHSATHVLVQMECRTGWWVCCWRSMSCSLPVQQDVFAPSAALHGSQSSEGAEPSLHFADSAGKEGTWFHSPLGSWAAHSQLQRLCQLPGCPHLARFCCPPSPSPPFYLTGELRVWGRALGRAVCCPCSGCVSSSVSHIQTHVKQKQWQQNP